ncbi:MAG: glucosaminidase domain-containing protein [Taibaiella sp.]|jgi:LysM repeat protein
MIRKFILLLCLTTGSFAGFAQKSYNEHVLDYIAKFKDLAMQEQQRTGIPASITLAQGIFETAAGSSELCTNASNHFGIKCKNTWAGETYTYTDDAKDECFRKYQSAIHSYKDHSDFLKTNQRYSLLFNLSPTDYASWAYGLKRCGYATNPQYAKKLIKFIEDYKLQEYTYTALGNNEEEVLLASAQEKMIPRSKTVSTVVPGENIPVNDVYTTANNVDQAAKPIDDDEIFVEKASQQEQQSNSNITEYYQTTSKNGISGFYARRGDMLLEYAIKNKIRYAKLLEMNDLPDAPLEADMFIYLGRKAKTGKASTHTVEDGESLLQISQNECIQLQQLRTFNHLAKGEEPVPGTVLNLQAVADGAPQVYTSSATKKVNAGNYNKATSSNDGYVVAGKKEDTSREVVIDDTEMVSAPVKAERVNIADEKPVEETIAEERNARQERKPAQLSKKEESKMSALDKLKAHMDKTVYASNQEFEPKASGHYDEQPVASVDEEEVVTTPARRNNAVSARETKAEERKTRETVKKKETVKPKAKVKAKNHTVKRGETLFEIAQKYDLTVSQLQKLNKLGSKKIQPGMKLKVVK